MSDLVFEIGTEEIPARFMPDALAQLKEGFIQAADAELMKPGRVEALGTPRRLALLAWGLPERQPDRVEERTGPPKRAAIDQNGAYTKAAEGFARGQGVKVEDLRVKQTDKGEVMAVKKAIPGRPAVDVLAGVLGSLVASMQFPKSMRWSDLDQRFVRPVHWILAVLAGEILPIEFAGVRSSNKSRGHRFESPEEFSVSGPDDYLAKLMERGVMVDPQKRSEAIRGQLVAMAERVGGQVGFDQANQELLEEVTFLTETPHAVLGHFDAGYLDLPEHVLVTPMRHHQKYFPVRDRQGKLMPAFISVANLAAGDDAVIAKGNERVLKARLDDARFFFEEDLKVPLEKRVEALAGMVFQERLGSYLDKARRIERIVEGLARKIAPDKVDTARRAAKLCKADLVTQMVGEFPELQGLMGTVYALRQGEQKPVARAIAGHYLPRSAGADELPDLPDEAYMVSLADRADTICGCFSAGLKPSGSGDPYMLRRHALAIIAILLKTRYKAGLNDLLGMAAEALSGTVEVGNETMAEIREFFRDRIYYRWTNSGGRPDVADAVLASGFDDLPDAQARWEALSEFAMRPDFEPLAIAFKRVFNILREVEPGPVDPALFEHEAEAELLRAFESMRSAVEQELEAGRYVEALSRLASLKGPIDKFFDDVLVMCEDAPRRENRMRLLAGLAALFKRLADFKRLTV